MSTTSAEQAQALMQNTGGGETSEGAEIAANIRRLVRVCHDELGYLSDAEASQQLQYAERVQRDRSILSDAKSSYSDSMTERTIDTNRGICDRVTRQLDEAMESNVISSKSYDEWLRWLKDPGRRSTEKKSSIFGELQSYLRKREALANDRLLLMKDERVNDPDKIKDGYLKGLAKYLMENDSYFDELSFTGRRNLISTIKAYLEASKGGKEYEKQFKEFKEELVAEATSSQPAMHRDKVGLLLGKVYEDDPSPEEVKKRMETLRKRIKVWRAKNVEFWDLRDDLAFQGIRTEWLDTGSFLGKSWKGRQKYVANMKEQKALAKKLKGQAMGKISQAAWALDASGEDRWYAQYTFNGNHSLEELSGIISGRLTLWLSMKMDIVSDFNTACRDAEAANVEKSKIPDRTAFLSKKFEAQLSDYHNLCDAIKEQKYLASHPNQQKSEVAPEDIEGRKAELQDELNELLDTNVGPPANLLVGESLERGSENFEYLRKYIGNFKWCVDHGYMNPSNTEELDAKAEKDTKKILRKNTHQRKIGFENIDLDNTAEKENAMRAYDQTHAATLYHLTCSKGSSRIALLNKFDNKNVGMGTTAKQGNSPGSDMYWSTLHMRDVPYGENYRLAQDEMWKFKGKILELESLGGHFERRKPDIEEEATTTSKASSEGKETEASESQVTMAA